MRRWPIVKTRSIIARPPMPTWAPISARSTASKPSPCSAWLRLAIRSGAVSISVPSRSKTMIGGRGLFSCRRRSACMRLSGRPRRRQRARRSRRRPKSFALAGKDGRSGAEIRAAPLAPHGRRRPQDRSCPRSACPCRRRHAAWHRHWLDGRGVRQAARRAGRARAEGDRRADLGAHGRTLPAARRAAFLARRDARTRPHHRRRRRDRRRALARSRAAAARCCARRSSPRHRSA